MMVLLVTTTSGGNSKEYDTEKIMVNAEKEIMEDLHSDLPSMERPVEKFHVKHLLSCKVFLRQAITQNTVSNNLKLH